MAAIDKYITQMKPIIDSFEGSVSIGTYNKNAISNMNEKYLQCKGQLEEITPKNESELSKIEKQQLAAAKQVATSILDHKRKFSLPQFYAAVYGREPEYDVSKKGLAMEMKRARFIGDQTHDLQSFHDIWEHNFEKEDYTYTQEMMNAEYTKNIPTVLLTQEQSTTGLPPYMNTDLTQTLSVSYFDNTNQLCGLSMFVCDGHPEYNAIILSKNNTGKPEDIELYFYEDNNPNSIAQLQADINSDVIEGWLFSKENNPVLNSDASINFQNIVTKTNEVNDTKNEKYCEELQVKVPFFIPSYQQLQSKSSVADNVPDELLEAQRNNFAPLLDESENKRESFLTSHREKMQIILEQERAEEDAQLAMVQEQNRQRLANKKALRPKEPASKPKDTMSRNSCLQTAGAFLACGTAGVLSTGLGAIVGGFVGMALGGPPAAAAGLAIGAIAGSAVSGVLAKLAGKRAGKAAPDDDFPLDAEEAGRPRGPRGP